MTRRSRVCRPVVLVAAALLCAIATAPMAAPPGGRAAAVPGFDDHFALETTSGHAVTETSFRGKWLLVYFGYTNCPDACPTALSAMAAALDTLGPLAARVQPLFVTVDPARDTPAVLAKYVGTFDRRIIGLYGTAAETDAAANAFRVYHTARKLGRGDYAIDHSAFIYVVDPGGRVVELLTGDLPGRTIAAALRDAMK